MFESLLLLFSFFSNDMFVKLPSPLVAVANTLACAQMAKVGVWFAGDSKDVHVLRCLFGKRGMKPAAGATWGEWLIAHMIGKTPEHQALIISDVGIHVLQADGTYVSILNCVNDPVPHEAGILMQGKQTAAWKKLKGPIRLG